RLIPWAPDILAGHLWPPVTGRAVLAAVNGSETTQVRETQPWAPAGATEIRSNRGWIVHTSDDWVHGDESAGRDGLIGMVRGWVGTRELIPEGRSLFLAKEEGRWRIWMISPHVETLHDSLDSALTGDDTGGLGNALVNMARVVDLTRGDSPEAVLLRDQALTSITVTDSGKIWCMDPLRMSADSNGTHDVVSQVRTLVLSRHQADPDGVAKRLRTALIAAKTKLAGGRTPPSIFDEIFA
ncbi:MAG: hypothetical protein OEZ37_13655, partial [Gemmatimonadota bacterium]|nr:hypothetical protein [Gemmatimonadota bacterium]